MIVIIICEENTKDNDDDNSGNINNCIVRSGCSNDTDNNEI